MLSGSRNEVVTVNIGLLLVTDIHDIFANDKTRFILEGGITWMAQKARHHHETSIVAMIQICRAEWIIGRDLRQQM
jgi:hypothetical protein